LEGVAALVLGVEDVADGEHEEDGDDVGGLKWVERNVSKGSVGMMRDGGLLTRMMLQGTMLRGLYCCFQN
jgi:hypothetical protein